MINKTSYKDQVYEYLKSAIIKGDLQPGEIYSEQMFAERLNVSRTPVREAVLQLKHENMIEVFNNRGLSVKPILFEDIQQIIQARMAIEGFSVRYLAQQIDTAEGKETLKKLEACMGQEREFSSSEAHYEFMKADISFHEVIVAFTKNPYFIRTSDMMHTRLEQVVVHSLASEDRHMAALQEHEDILEAIRSGDAVQAQKAFEAHMLITERILSKTVQKQSA